jgi:alkylation response protein AidB-like acyl-CoA dehydrogenase
MNFSFTEEQVQLRDALRRVLAENYSFERRRASVRTAQACDPAVWRQFAELGILGLVIPEPLGGIGGDMVDAMVVMEELGRALVVEPFLSTALVGASILARAGHASHQRLLPAVAAGEIRLAFAHCERDSRWRPDAVATRAVRESGQWILDGHKAMVPDGAGAHHIVVSARAAAGISLFLVPGTSERMTRAAFATHDGSGVAEITIDRVRLPADALIGTEGGGLPLIEAASDVAIAGLCAEAVGAMDALVAMTLEYVKTRRQFGVPIGSFQALQHRLADMLLHVELARSLTCLVSTRLAAGDELARRRAVSAAKFLVGRSARLVGQEAVQMHGGMGVSDEVAASHYFKRLTLINASFGDMEHHLERFGSMLTPAA